MIGAIRVLWCWIRTRHADDVLELDAAGRLYLRCPRCGRRTPGWPTPWTGDR